MAGVTKKHIAGCSHDPVPEHIVFARPGRAVRLNICDPHGNQLSQAMSYVDAVRISRELASRGIGALIEPDQRTTRRAFHDAIVQGNVTSLLIGCGRCGEVQFVVLVMAKPATQPAKATGPAKAESGEPKAESSKHTIQSDDDLPATLPIVNAPLVTLPLVSTGEAANSAVSTAETCADRRREIRVARHKCVDMLVQLSTPQLCLLLGELAISRVVHVFRWLFSPIDS